MRGSMLLAQSLVLGKYIQDRCFLDQQPPARPAMPPDLTPRLFNCLPSSVLVLGHVARGETCRTRGAAVGVPQALLDGIDETTPLDACTKSVCAATRWGACSGKATAMSLVMSDEFGNPKKSLAVGVRDRKWTAEKVGAGCLGCDRGRGRGFSQTRRAPG